MSVSAIFEKKRLDDDDDDDDVCLFGTLLDKPPRTMNRDYEGISGSPGVNQNLTMRESLDRQRNKKLTRRASLVHQNNTDTIQATLIAWPLPATHLSTTRGGTAAWQRGISTSWVPRHTRGHFPSHRTLKTVSPSHQKLATASPFPRTTD